MKSNKPLKIHLAAVAVVAAFSVTSAVADVVYVTSTCSNATSTTVCNSAINQDLNANGQRVYNDAAAGFTTALSAKPDGPTTPGARYFSNSFSNSVPDGSVEGIVLRPSLGTPGGTYVVYHIFSSAAGNVSSDIVLGVTNVENCTLSFDTTDKFQASNGVALFGKNVYQRLGFLTNDAGLASPTIRFYFKGGVVNATLQKRLIVDTFKFRLLEPCLLTSDVVVTGPLAANSSTVVVGGVDASASKITIYQDSGSGFVEIGSSTAGIVGGINNVAVTGLVKGARVAATQTIAGQEGCAPTGGTLVGGGANPPIRIALSIRETASTGPIGDPGQSTNANIHFLGASTLSAGAPVDATIIYPSNDWQTVTFSRAQVTAPSPANVSGTVADGTGYPAGSVVKIQVYAIKSLGYTNVYSAVPTPSATVTSNSDFIVNWTWAAVPDAVGYRVYQDVGGSGWQAYTELGNVTTFADSNTGWNYSGELPVPTSDYAIPSIQWNTGTTPSGTFNAIGTPWGILEAIALCVADPANTGPFDIYIDNIQNGTTVFQSFETAPAGTTDYGFRTPTFSGSTSGNLLFAPNVGSVVNRAADTGTKSFEASFQWQTATPTSWLRLTTSGVNNPQVDLSKDISFRLLMVPIGASLPAAPAAPTLAVSSPAGKTVLNWTGGHRLQTSVGVTGTYTNVPQVLSPNTWTNIYKGAFLAPWTNNYTEATRFFRLRD